MPYLGPADERRAHEETNLEDGELPTLSMTPKRVKGGGNRSPHMTLYTVEPHAASKTTRLLESTR